MRMGVFFVILLAFFASSLGAASTANPLSLLEQTPRAAVWLGDPWREPLYEIRGEAPLVPASTLKILTAWLALEKWGPDHRFRTRFLLKGDTLWVRGGGDPYLTSEELMRLAAHLATALEARGLRRLAGIGLDASLFSGSIAVPGRGNSRNPYDAVPSALAANFNTLSVVVEKGKVRSAEPQTPVVPLTYTLASKALKRGKERISIHDPAQAARYFGELLRYFLRAEGVTVGENIRLAHMPQDARPLYMHENSLPLKTVLKNMLEYSNNFIANQIFLLLPLDEDAAGGVVASMPASARWVSRRLRQEGGLGTVRIIEGAGLSRDNRISARDLARVLVWFEPWKGLLKAKGEHLLYKTGTLNGVRTLAGYVRGSEVDGWQPFVVFINEPRPHALRFQAVEQLRRQFLH